MPRICILNLIGLPAAGKTTFSRWFLLQEHLNFKVLHLCYDNFLHFSHSNEVNFKLQRLQILKILQTLVDAMRQNQKLPDHLKDRIQSNFTSNANDYVIICDDNNYYRSMRYKLYNFCRFNRLSYAQIFIECTLETACERNAKRAQIDKVAEHVIHQMSQRLEIPNVQGKSWEANTLMLKTENQNISSAAIYSLPFILAAFENILEPPAKYDAQLPNGSGTTPTIIHQIDILLRRRIKDLLTNEVVSCSVEKVLKANKLNAKRKEILQELRESDEAVLKEIDLERFADFLK